MRAQAVFKEADMDGNGELTIQEFTASITAAMSTLPNQARLAEYMETVKGKFPQFDTDGSGGLSQREWMAVSSAGQQAAAAAQQLKGVFEAADKDKDLALTTAEMLEGFSKYGYDQKQIDTFFKMGDGNADGMLTFDEFIAGRTAMQRAKEMEAMAEAYQSEDEQIKAFAQADINKDGKLSLLEYTTSMQEFLKSMGSDTSAIAPKQIAESFSQFDADADGRVTQEEWLAAVRRNAATKAEL